MAANQLSTAYRNIPVAVRKFLLKCVVLLIVWKLLYIFVLLPHRIPDQALTNLTARTTVVVLSAFYDKVSVVEDAAGQRAHIFVDGKLAVDIADPCNALELYVLYIGFLICMPANFKRQLIFGLTGVAIIFIVNIARCAALVWFHFEQQQYFDYVHKYVFTLVVYGIIFLCWVLYSKTDAREKTV